MTEESSKTLANQATSANSVKSVYNRMLQLQKIKPLQKAL